MWKRYNLEILKIILYVGWVAIHLATQHYSWNVLL